ncbi:hypothetical protein B0O99DRAFT_594009 [Bisporella sp. PMI_857]|nr:hypothetical protein B0O99DRAFT_594009 [Bisporella sp. PMI_857]
MTARITIKPGYRASSILTTLFEGDGLNDGADPLVEAVAVSDPTVATLVPICLEPPGLGSSSVRTPTPDVPISNDSSTPFHQLESHVSHHEDAPTIDGRDSTVQTPMYGDPRSIELVIDICELERSCRSGYFYVTDAVSLSLIPEDHA